MELNRRNINRAISDNLLKDLGEYHWAQGYKLNTNDASCKILCLEHRLIRDQIFLASFLFAELPSGLISKKLGADR